jgi:hypothetical protein
MDIIIKQAPANLTKEEIEIIYNKNNNDIVNTLAELWDIVDDKIIPPKTKWENMRETCDAYDLEMEKVMKRNK